METGRGRGGSLKLRKELQWNEITDEFETLERRKHEKKSKDTIIFLFPETINQVLIQLLLLD